MKTFKNLAFLYLLLIFGMTGCITSLQTRSLPTDAVTATSDVVLSLTTPKLTYASKEAIFLELSIQGGEFDLLVPFVGVATSGAFTQLKVTDANGNTVEPKNSIARETSEEIFIEKDGKSIQCIQGFELKAATTQVISLADLRKPYELQKGTYTIALAMELPIYRDFLKKRHPEVMELEEEIKRIKKVADMHVSAADKRSAVSDLQQQIDFLEKKHEDIYLPIKSLLGKALLASNSVILTIE